MAGKCLIAIFLLLFAAAEAQSPRVTLSVGKINVPYKQSTLALPIYISNPLDSIAGVEFWLKMEPNYYIEFETPGSATSPIPMDDTAGTLMSGWEWIGISSLEKSPFDLKVAAMADWPGGKKHPPLLPQAKGVLINLHLNVKNYDQATGQVIPITIMAEKSGFSDPFGNSIGIVTTMVKKCREYRGDSCLEWRMVRVAALDSAIVRFESGRVAFPDTVASRPEIEENNH